MSELSDLIATADRIARTGDRLTRAFADDLTRIWRQIERLIAAEIASTSASAIALRRLRRKLRDAFTDAGFDEFATKAAVDSVATMAAAVGTSRIPRAALSDRLAALQAVATGNLLAQGDNAANALYRAVSQHLAGSRDVRDILRSLTKTLDREAHEVGAVFDTQVSIFGRQVEDLRSQKLPPDQPYLYSGPIDGRTREWCLQRVGKIYTRDEIDRMDNGQIPNVFLSAGGYRCRHSFLAVESRALRELSNTGQRADGYDAQIERVEQWKAAQKRRKAA